MEYKLRKPVPVSKEEYLEYHQSLLKYAQEEVELLKIKHKKHLEKAEQEVKVRLEKVSEILKGDL